MEKVAGCWVMQPNDNAECKSLGQAARTVMHSMCGWPSTQLNSTEMHLPKDTLYLDMHIYG